MKRFDRAFAICERASDLPVMAGFARARVGAWAFVGLLTIAALPRAQPVVAADGSQVVQEVFAAWSARQERVRSAKFEWKQETIQPYVTFDGEAADGSSPKQGDTTIVHQSSTLRLDGDRFDSRITTPDAVRLNQVPYLRCSFDGSVSQRFNQARTADLLSSGIVTGVAHDYGTDSIDLQPLLLTYRPLHPTMLNLRAEDYLLAEKRGTIDGRSCYIIDEKESGPIRNSYWIDVERDCIVLRSISTVNGKDSILQDISYRQDSRHGWIPANWRTVFTREDGSFGLSKTHKMMDYAINEPIPLAEFQIEFPVGTSVTDRVAGRTYVVERSSWLPWLWIAAPLCFGLLVVVLLGARRGLSRR